MKTETKGIIFYLLIAFGLAWIEWGIVALAGFDATNPLFQALVLPGAFAPAISCFIVRQWITKEGFKDAGLKLFLKRNWTYYLFAWLSPLVIAAIVVILATSLGLAEPDFSLQRFTAEIAPQLDPPAIAPATWFVIPLGLLIQALLVATPITWGEEFGWRSYLQIRLFCNTPLLAALTTGIIWGIWHYPLIFMGYERYENPILGLFVFTVFTTLLSIIFGWLRLKTRSVWSASLAHGATNAVGGSITLMLFAGSPNWMFVGYNGILAWIPLGIICAWIILTGQLAAVSPTPKPN